MTQKAKAFALFDQGKRPADQEVKNLGLKPKSVYNYFQEWKKLSGAGPPTGTLKGRSLPVPLGKETDETTEAAVLKLVPQVQTIPLTPGIYNGYLCAKIRGFPGTIAHWL